ncbi:MAG: hypothetical protein ACOYOJ_01430 [Alsobacter sp.]
MSDLSLQRDVVGSGRRVRSPAFAVGLVLACALGLRIWAALVPVQDYYQDELYQYLEQGHRLAFGYGFVPWEYDWGIRNWVLPALIGGVLAGLDRLGFGEPGLYRPVLTCIALALSMTLVMSARRFAAAFGGPRAGLLAAAGVALSGPCIGSAPKLTPEVLGAYTLMGCLALATAGTRRALLMSGVLAGVTVGLRLQYAPAMLVAALVVLRFAPQTDARLAWIAGGMVGAGAFGAVDWATYGSPFASYVGAVIVNVRDGAADSFGHQPAYFYLPVLGTAGLLYLAVATTRWREAWAPLAAAAIILGVNMAIGHKEGRFIFAVHGLLAVAAAVALMSHPRLVRVTAIATLAMALLNTAMMTVAPEPLSLRVEGVRAAFQRAARDPDLKGLLAIGITHDENAGFYGLHRNIPLRLDHAPLEAGRAVHPGYTHVIVPDGAVELAGFDTVARLRAVELRKRRDLQPGAGRPPDAGDANAPRQIDVPFSINRRPGPFERRG